MIRRRLPEFDLANPIYAGAVVTVQKVDVTDLSASDLLATLYTGPTTTNLLTNPVTLDLRGRWPRNVYCAESVIMAVDLAGSGPSHSTGVIPRPGYAHGDWADDVEYWPGDMVTNGDAEILYECQVPHTSDADFDTDLTAGYWAIVVEPSGIEEAPEDGTPYGREDADWVLVASDARMTAAENAISALAGGIAYIGTYDATAHTADYTPASGYSDGVLVAASAAVNKYVIVTTAGTGASPAPVVALAIGDLLLSDGSTWNKVPLSAQTFMAVQVLIDAIAGVTGTEVQTALESLKALIDAEAATREADDDTEAATRAAAVSAEAAARIAADGVLTTAVNLRLTDAANDTFAYGRRGAAWVKVVQRSIRNVLGTTDTPTAATDRDGIIYCKSNSATTITANDLGDGIQYSIQQRGTGAVTVAAGSGVTLVSDKGSASYTTARRGAWLHVSCDGSGNVYVAGNTA